MQLSTNQSARIDIKDRSVVNFRRSTAVKSYGLAKEETAEVVVELGVRGGKEQQQQRGVRAPTAAEDSIFICAPLRGRLQIGFDGSFRQTCADNMASLKAADGVGGLASDNHEDASGQIEFDELLQSNVLDTLADL